MQPKHHVILYTFLGLALVIAIFLGFDYSVKAAAATQILEDDYTQRVLETQEHLQAISIKLGKVPIAANIKTQVELLTGISKQADSVATGLSALPLSHVAMNDTVKFSNQLSEYTMRLALTIVGGGELSAADAEQIRELESQCTLLVGQFVTARDTMLAESLRLAGNQNAYYQEAQLAARPLEQVADSDNGMDYPSMIYDGAFSDARHNGVPKALGNDTVLIDAGRAIEIAREFIGAQRVKEATQDSETAGVLACFDITLTLVDGTVLTAGVTKQGGKLLWIVPEHASFAPSLTLDECSEKAKTFLTARKYGDMEANHFQVYDGLAVINFAALQEGVLLYPDLVKIQIRMDTGEVVGLESNNYLMNHEIRTGLVPILTKSQALQQVSNRLSTKDARLCLISHKDKELLCYEVPGLFEGREYRVFVDAATGEEVQILVIVDTANGVLAA